MIKTTDMTKLGSASCGFAAQVRLTAVVPGRSLPTFQRLKS